jgi:hypothetical protein
VDFLFHLVVTTPREKGIQCNHLGFDLFRVGRIDTLYIEVDFDKERVGFMIQERRELEEQFSCLFVSLRACL